MPYSQQKCDAYCSVIVMVYSIVYNDVYKLQRRLYAIMFFSQRRMYIE